ncbi:MAG: hypothetical protein SO314_05570 [Alphaproteobacteria bacterium]|nr:hypothetical protein [Alphaproteobacteria bacterium]
MELLNIPFSRDKVAEVFKNRFGLTYANSMTRLIQFKNGKIAWLYSSATGQEKALCTGKNEYRLLSCDEDIPPHHNIGRDEYFYINKSIYQCRSQIKNQLLIKKISQVLRAEDAQKILKLKETPAAYKIVQPDGSISNIIWKKNGNKTTVHVFALLEANCSCPPNCQCIPLEYAEEINIGKQRWMYHTEKGLPILRELIKEEFWRKLSR